MKATNINPYLQRRANLFKRFKSGIAIVANSEPKVRSQDTFYRFVPGNHFYYLTGFAEAKSLLVLDFDQGRSILFCLPKDELAESWEGRRFGPELAKEVFGFDEAYPIGEFETYLNSSLEKTSSVHFSLGNWQNYDQLVISAINKANSSSRRMVSGISEVINFNQFLDEMRLFKDNHEIELLRKSASIGCKAHNLIMRSIKDLNFEYQVEGKLLGSFYHEGAQGEAYTSIVAGGANACTLHYSKNDCALNKNELLLLDAGCNYQSYACDITRTFPIGGSFSKPQREIYEIVLAANKAGIKEIKPGGNFVKAKAAATEVITQGLLDLGILQGSLKNNIEEGTYRKFFMHGLGHWLGMDVHDVGSYVGKDKLSRSFEPGMYLTVEPGLYFKPDPAVNEQYWNIGVRIEDDVLVTENAQEIFTEQSPKDVNEICRLINGD